MWNWKRMVGAIKDKNSLWITSMSRRSVYCNPDLEAAIIKATSHDETRIDYKNAQRVYAWIRTSPAFNLKPLIWSLSYRMDRTRSWVVAIKGLMLLHGVFCCKIPILEMIGRLPFDLSNFRDLHSSANKTWGYDAFVRAYFTFLDQKSMLLCANEDPKGRMILREECKDRPIMGDIQILLKSLALLDSLLQIRPQMECMKRACLIREAMDCVIIEIFDAYSKVCSCIAGVLSKIYMATHAEASMALSLLRRANVQGDELSKYFELCWSIGVLNVSEFVKVERIPEEDIQEVERVVIEITSDHKSQEMGKAIVPMAEKVIMPAAQSMALMTVITDKWEVFEDVRTFDIRTNPFETTVNHPTYNGNYIKQEIPDLICF
ncbi:hypothetical protein MLD38_025126 [Melastoma candidum]|uniref:Uncharacterized protein n=1 Tax=Melastoma candidum TaxID=119954 RepID=A0ACB9NU41_9MYRT|nr:hypothetical protein MLD38_025126 [Melastoma candidum]